LSPEDGELLGDGSDGSDRAAADWRQGFAVEFLDLLAGRAPCGSGRVVVLEASGKASDEPSDGWVIGGWFRGAEG